MERDPADTSVLTFCGEAGAADSTEEAGGAELTIRYQIISGSDRYLVDIYWPKDTGLAGSRVTRVGDLPKGWEAEFWTSDARPLGRLVLNVPLNSKVGVV